VIDAEGDAFGRPANCRRKKRDMVMAARNAGEQSGRAAFRGRRHDSARMFENVKGTVQTRPQCKKQSFGEKGTGRDAILREATESNHCSVSARVTKTPSSSAYRN